MTEQLNEEAMQREELVEMLKEMTQRLVDLPIDASLSPITNADLASFMMVVTAILRK